MGRPAAAVAETRGAPVRDGALEQLRRAQRLAGRLNLLPIAAFGLWSLPAKAFWLIMIGLIPAPFAVPPAAQVWPWLIGALLTGPPAFLLPRAFHRPWHWEYRGIVYRALGVGLFRAIVANGDMVNRFVRARFGAYAVYGQDHARLLPKSIFNERRHIAYLCWGFVSAYYAFSLGLVAWAFWLAVTNVGANLYPIMLQRYSRARVMRLEDLRRRRGRGLRMPEMTNA